MASTIPPVKGSSYSFEVSLIDQSDTDLFKANPTLAAGDVVVYQDGALDGNIDSLPTAIGASAVLTVTLSASEMDADRVTVLFSDQAGDEWCDLLVHIETAGQTLDTIDGNVDSILTDTGTTLDGKLNTIDSNVDAVLLDTGTDGVVLANDAITAAKIAANAITSSEIATSAAQEIADEILKRGVSNVEDSADAASLAAMILAAFESKIAGTTWTIYKTNHSDTFTTRTVTVDAAASPIKEVT